MKSKRKYRKRPLEEHNSERMKHLSGLFLECRRWTGMSRKDIEDEYGISRAVIERVESSTVPMNITLRTILEMADIYMISPSELFEDLE
ncbi:MAG: helix-turn-helix transcriptional regulator [Bacteroidales bacterium]|nr:helix-turn-helix transcriptional regulator [Bacteroidales bacterium]